jgi:hypothetical protein
METSKIFLQIMHVDGQAWHLHYVLSLVMRIGQYLNPRPPKVRPKCHIVVY